MSVSDEIKNSKANISEKKREMIRAIVEAKKNSTKRAGIVKSNDSGGIDSPNPIPPPTNPIHKFPNLEKCECECHNRGKFDCEKCYDHPEHLKNFKKLVS